MATLDDFRQLPQYKDFSDEQLVVTLSQKYGIEPGEIAQEFGVSYNPQRNPLVAGLSAGVDQLQGLSYGAIGAGARALGAEGVADWADRGVTRNYAESAFNGRSDLERVEGQSLGSALPFLGYQVAKQVPMLAGTLAASAAVPQAAIPAALSRGLAVIPKGLGGGGLKAGMDFAGRRAALEAGNAFGRTIAASYPIGVGAMYGEAVERGDPSQGDALAALGLGVPYGAAEAVMPSMVRNAFGSNAARFAGGLPTRLAKAGGLGFAGEAGTELFQNELEMGFAGDLTQDEIDSRRLNSAVIGGLVGGTFNLPAGFRGQRNPADPIDLLNRDTTPQPEAAPQVGQSELNFGVTGEEAIGTRGLRNPFDAAGYVSGFQQGQETTVDVPQSDLFGGVNEMPPVDIPRAPKIDIPVPRSLQNDPVRSAVAQASPATLRRDGTLKRNVEEAIAEYEGFPLGEIERSIEALSTSRKAESTWRIAALEAIARQRAAQGAPNVAQVDAASGQGAGVVPAGGAGNTPSGPVVLDGVRQPAGAPAPSSAARVPVGEPVVQQPAGVAARLDAARTSEEVREILRSTDAAVLVQEVASRPDLFPKIQAGMSPPAWRMFSEDVAAAQQGAPVQNVPPTQQVAPQAQEARGQEGAQAGAEQSRDAERAQVSRIFDTLSEREREILTKYHFDKMTFEEIGSELKERGESGTTRQRIEQQHKEALKKLAEAGRPFGLTPERLRLYFPDESRRMAGGADVKTASAAEVAQSGAGMTYRDESNNGAVNQANDEFEMADAVDGAEALDLDTDIAREEFDEGFRGEQGADADALEQVEAVESMVRTELDHKGIPLQPVDFEDAASDYDLMADEGDTPFAELPRQIQVQWVKAWVAAQDGALTDQQLVSVFSEIADQYAPEAQTVEPGTPGTSEAVPANARGESENPTDTRDEVAADEIDSRTLGVGDGNRYSRTADTQGTTVEAVRSAINAIATPMGRRKVTVYQTADEAVQNGALNSKDAKGTQGWVDAKGNAFFIAGNIPNGSELAVVLHEIGAHLGIEKLLTDAQYKALVKKIFAWAQSDANTQEARIARAALARVDAAKPENEADLAPETIAYFVEEAVKAGVNPTAMQYKTELGRWFRTLWAAFKVALRRLNLINADRLTAQNVVDLAYGAARVSLASAYHGTAANFRRFDHRYMGSGEGAQAFGWGTYLAQRFGIANEYFKADVGRKSGVLYKGEAVKQSWPRGQEPTDLETALAAVAARFADSYSLRTKLQKGTVTTSDFKSAITDAQYELASGNDMGAHDALENVRPEDFGVGQAEGNIHVVDVNFTEDEMLDWFEPISKQSPQVRDALETVRARLDNGEEFSRLEEETDRLNADWDEFTGADLIGTERRPGVLVRAIEDGMFPETNDRVSAYQAASEYLDSLGIKGIKFLDAVSRSGAAKLKATTQQNNKIIAQNDVEIARLQKEIDLNRDNPGVLPRFFAVRESDIREYERRNAALRAEIDDLKRSTDGLTNNLVVFNDRNIYRVGSMRGGPVDKGGRMMFSKTADPQLVEIAEESGRRTLKAIQAGLRKGWTGLAFSSHLTDAAVRAGLTSARALKLVQDKKQTAAYEIQIEVEKVLSKFASLEGKIGNDDAATVVQRFIHDSTFDQKWGFMPDWKEDATVDPEMESRFKAIERANPQAAEVIKDVFRHGDAIFRKKQDLLRKTTTGEYEALIKAETDDGKRRKLERQRDKELREAGKLLTALRGPYSPLRSYGDYVVIAKSQKFRDAEAAGPVDPELKRDRRHYVVDFARTLYEAEKLQADLEADFGKGMVWAGKKETSTEQFGELPFMAVQRLRKMVDTDLDGDLNTKSKRVLNKLLVDLYISTLHEANARHSEQKRQFVNRATRDRAAQDMMRAFATQGRADSHLVSALQFNSEIVDKMQAMRDQAKQGGDSMLRTHLRNEILQRHMMDLDFRETPVHDKLMSLNSFWMLLTSPGYYVQNAFQVIMMTQPVLAGRFGQIRSMRQLMRGYQDAMRVLKGSSWNEAADLSRFSGTADEKAMLVELQARGLLDFGISAELGYWEASGEISKVFNQTMRKVGMATRKLEVLNRMTSALAAYRMMYERSAGTQTERHAAAVEYADSIINDTHGNYGTSNAPRYLRMLPKPMTQFRKFQLFQLSLFAKVIHGSVKGASPQEKRVMLATLGYLFMNHALLAGAVGVPASALLGAIYAIAGDDDDPNDWEVDVRRAIGDKEIADLILHGLPSLININMSNKIGAGTMLDPLPFVEYEASRGGYEKAVTAAMGPLIGGLGAQVVDGFGRILKGDVAQGTAQLLPRGFRDAARGFMAAQDGIKLRNGQTALTPEELSFYDSLMMGLGLPTMKTTGRAETQLKTQQYETFFRERATKLKRQYSEAYEENDRQAMLEARQAWAEMQASRKNLGFKVQPLSELLKAPREKAKAEAKLENGVRTSEQARGFVQSLQ